MTERALTITLDADLRSALRAAGHTDQGEFLNFESPADFFGGLSEKRWALVRALQGQGELAVRELARRIGRDVKRVHDDVTALADIGLVERTETGGVVCLFASIHIDMHLRAAA